MESSHVILHPLSFITEGDEVIVGRADTETYAVFPADAADIVRRLLDGAPLDEAAAWYAEEYGETPDMGDLVETLRGLGFVRETGETAPVAPPRNVTRFGRLARRLFSPVAGVLFVLVMAVCGYAMVQHPWLRPGPSRITAGDSLLGLLLIVLVSQLAGIALHETFHVLAARRLGVPASVTIGRRLYFLVFQTTLTGLMGVPRSKRILPFCAGLLADALFGSALLGVAWACHGHGSAAAAAGHAAMAALYLTVLRMAWQFLVFMETDLYYVLAQLLRCPDLHALSRAYLRNRYWQFVRRPERMADQSVLTGHERAVVRVYAPVVFVCSAAMMVGMLTFALPALGTLIHRFAVGIARWSVTDPHWWDSVLTLIFVLLEPALVAAMAFRDHRGGKRSAGTAARIDQLGPQR
ncbi:hypothetical protein [Streptomyces sp. NBC_01477]|uniref:hypothetical protein n=1 Tax=Streptomyces sp. NBC_01477 TaxID=2976015 RepID=UPI002E3388B8|nr:hypothetical protein [Streptomyces sp. NBC_01477]